MTAFLLADVSTDDMDGYKASGYLDAVPKIATLFGGVYRVRGGAIEILEGDWQPKRMVVIEFPTMEDLKAFYESDEYLPFKQIRQRITVSKIVAVEGL